MKKLSCLLILAATLSSTAWAACKPPDSPRKFPDGKTATKEQMLTAKQVFEQFNAKTDAYLACVKDEHEALLKKNPKADDDLKKEFMDGYQLKTDRAMSEAEHARDDLNEQLRAYKVAHPK